MIAINQVAGPVIAGCAASCGAVLAVAGASKLYRGVRGLDDMTAISRALRLSRRQWRLFGLAAGGAECAAGGLVCSGAYPVPGGASLAALGAVFCGLLAYALARRVPGGCGCIRWRAATGPASEAVTWRALARSGTMLCAGIASAVVSPALAAPPDLADAPGRYWFGGGAAAGLTVLVLLSMTGPVRTPVCRRPLWRRTRTTLRALASHEIFAAMAGSAGPFWPVARYRRTGCTDEFWFTPLAGQGAQAVVFAVRRTAGGGRLAVHTSLRDPRAPGTSLPGRAIAVADVLAEVPRDAGNSDYRRVRERPAPTAAGQRETL